MRKWCTTTFSFLISYLNYLSSQGFDICPSLSTYQPLNLLTLPCDLPPAQNNLPRHRYQQWGATDWL